MRSNPNVRQRWRNALVPVTLFGLFTLVMSLALAVPAWADPPGRIGRVAYVSRLDGLYVGNAASGESFRAPLNQPLTSGDVLTTDGASRAEIQIGALTIRLDRNTSLELARVDDDQVALALRNGRSIVKINTPETAREFSLSTPDGRFTARDTGIYRFDVDNASSNATAYFGSLRFSGNGTAFDINANSAAQIWYDRGPRYQIATAASDEFTHFSAERDRNQRNMMATRYVSPEMTGIEDLDTYGDWQTSGEYGALWIPRDVGRDWAPYRDGRWTWVAPWGWTWVGSEPWGFAPFHYGRWVFYHGTWAWVPGIRESRPVFAPALVAWTRPPEFGVSFSISRAPDVGWFPLAPRDVFVPLFHASPDYVRHVNRPHVPRIEHIDVIVNDPRRALNDFRFTHRDEPRAITTPFSRPPKPTGDQPRFPNEATVTPRPDPLPPRDDRGSRPPRPTETAQVTPASGTPAPTTLPPPAVPTASAPVLKPAGIPGTAPVERVPPRNFRDPFLTDAPGGTLPPPRISDQDDPHFRPRPAGAGQNPQATLVTRPTPAMPTATAPVNAIGNGVPVSRPTPTPTPAIAPSPAGMTVTSASQPTPPPPSATPVAPPPPRMIPPPAPTSTPRPINATAPVPPPPTAPTGVQSQPVPHPEAHGRDGTSGAHPVPPDEEELRKRRRHLDEPPR